VVLEPRRSVGNGFRAVKGNAVQDVSIRFSSEVNVPCSDERGFMEEVTESVFMMEPMNLIYLTALHDVTSESLRSRIQLFWHTTPNGSTADAVVLLYQRYPIF
jgi:hypothetical protein